MTSSQQVQTATEQFIADTGIVHQVVHGGVYETVTTESGPVPTLAGALAQGIVAGRNTGTLVFSTRAELYAWTTTYSVLPAKAEVIADAVAEYNGVYSNSAGGAGASAWTKIAELPKEIIAADDSGLGTPNAIVATTQRLPIDGSVVSLIAYATTTSEDVTIEFGNYPSTVGISGSGTPINTASSVGTVVGSLLVSYGNTAYSVRIASGAKPPVGGIVAGMPILGRIDQESGYFLLLTDITSTSIQAAALASATAAAASAEEALTAVAESDFTNYSTTAQIQAWFKADGTINAPVKYGPAGQLTSRGLAVDNSGFSINSEIDLKADAGYSASIAFYSGTTEKWILQKNAGNDFVLMNDAVAGAAFTVGAAANVVDFANMPTIGGQELSNLIASIEVLSGMYQYGSSGSWVVPDGVTRILVVCFGGGGGGGGYHGADGNYGGFGGWSLGLRDVTPGETISFTVGGGGSGGAASNNGSPGGATTCGTIVGGGGGGGGRGGGSAGSDGSGSGGLVNSNVYQYINQIWGRTLLATRLQSIATSIQLCLQSVVYSRSYAQGQAGVAWNSALAFMPGTRGLGGTLYPGGGGIGGAVFIFPVKGNS